ncbi:MAG: hypothetical protein HY303_05015, partial [Candidatus Wallbacteria bacterium]|nr:hypothetical protein [Candidatus Wallbacteria bacterium]
MTARRTAFLWLFAFACWTVSGCGIGVQANGNGQISVKIDAGVPAGGPAAPTGTANRPVGANPGFNPGGNPAAPDGGTLAKGDTNDVTGAIGPRAPSATAGGSAQGDHIVQVANNYVGADFPYAAATNGGRKGCAQVVSTILREAGVIPNVSLGVLQ